MNAGTSPGILTSPDVLVIGGGSAGIAAAAGAADQGATVTLLEKNAFAGGKATAANVGTVCGLYYRNESAEAQFVQQGFPKEFALELAARSQSQPIQHKNGLHFLPYNYIEFISLGDDWLKKTTQSVCFHSEVQQAVAENNIISEVKAMVGDKTISFRPLAVVDTTGGNVVSRMLQVKSIQSDYYQAAAHVFGLSGIQELDSTVLNMALIRAVGNGTASGLLPSFFERVSIVPGSFRNGNVLLKLPLPMLMNEEMIRSGELETFSYAAIKELYDFLKTNTQVFHESSITYVAPETGIRTGPRNEGKIILSGNDVLSCRKNFNSIARGAWPVEYWEPGKNVRMEYFEMGNYYDIPAGAVQSKVIANLFFGGRNISADDTAIASARVIGTCLATGFAAGVLAAAASVNKSQTDAIAAIQKALSIASCTHENS